MQFKPYDIVSSKNEVIKNREVICSENNNLVWIKDKFGNQLLCKSENLILIKRPFLAYFIRWIVGRFLKRLEDKYNPLNYKIVHKDDIGDY